MKVMMLHGSRTASRRDATRVLAEIGQAATPSTAHVADAHLAVISVAVAQERARAVRQHASRRPRRRAAALLAIGACAAIPSVAAAAGKLPEPMQRAAATAAAVVGLELPRPTPAPSLPARSEERPGDAGEQPRTGDRAAAATSIAGAGRGRGDEIRRTTPARPAPGEVRGNRFGQVDEGPDAGRAASALAAPPAKRAAVRAPAAQRASVPTPPAQRASVPTPAAAVSSRSAVRSGGGGGAPAPEVVPARPRAAGAAADDNRGRAGH